MAEAFSEKISRDLLATEAVYYASFFKVEKWTLFAPSVCDSIFELPSCCCFHIRVFAKVRFSKCTSPKIVPKAAFAVHF